MTRLVNELRRRLGARNYDQGVFKTRIFFSIDFTVFLDVLIIAFCSSHNALSDTIVKF